MSAVDPKYTPINRCDMIRLYQPTLHKKCMTKLQEICNRLDYVSLTCDI